MGAIRKKMTDIIVREGSTCDLKDLVSKFIPEVIGKEVEKACHGIYPLQNCVVRKVKVLKKPKFDMSKLLEIHSDAHAEDLGKVVPDALENPETDADMVAADTQI